MNFLKSMENGNINIKEMGIFKGLWVMFLSFLLEAIGALPSSLILLKNPKAFGEYSAYINFGIGVLVKFITIIFLLKFFSTKSYGEYKDTKTRITYKHFLFAAIALIGYRLIYDNSLYYYVNQMEMNPTIQKAFEEMAKYPMIMLLAVVVVAPLYEETVFRGIILNGMAKKLNPIMAILFSSLFFALMHRNLIQGINAFLLAIILGYIYLKTGSIYLSIFVHFINNALVPFIEPVKQLAEKGNVYIVSGTQIAVGLIFLIIACKWYVNNCNKKCSSDIVSFIGR